MKIFRVHRCFRTREEEQGAGRQPVAQTSPASSTARRDRKQIVGPSAVRHYVWARHGVLLEFIHSGGHGTRRHSFP